MNRRRAYPPEYDEEPPENGLVKFDIALGVCRTCREILGPTHADVVGQDIAFNHTTHDTDVLGTWTEVEVVDEERVFDPPDRGDPDR